MNVEDVLKLKRIAVVGMSGNPDKDAYKVPMYLKKAGYTIYPVNPNRDVIAGMKTFKRLRDVPRPVDIVLFFRPSEEIPKFIDEVLEVKPKVVWLQLGIYHKSVEELKKYGIEVFHGRCMMVEHQRLIGAPSS